MKIRIAPAVPAVLLTAASVLAHYTWIAPVDAALVAGRTATIQIGHGHAFPSSEEAIDASQVDLFVLTPSGARVKLEPVAGRGVVTARYAVKEAGLHRIALTQDRGVTSRTPRGARPGGRDRNPDATRASRTFRSAMSYARTANTTANGAPPAGLEFELAAESSNGAWRLQLLKQGRGVAGAAIQVYLAGAAAASTAGKTGADGRLTYAPPAGAAGPAMFFAEMTDTPPAGANYDVVNYEASLYVSW